MIGLREIILSNRSEYFINETYIGTHLIDWENGKWCVKHQANSNYKISESFVNVVKKINKYIIIDRMYSGIYKLITSDNNVKFIKKNKLKFNEDLFHFALEWNRLE